MTSISLSKKSALLLNFVDFLILFSTNNHLINNKMKSCVWSLKSAVFSSNSKRDYRIGQCRECLDIDFTDQLQQYFTFFLKKEQSRIYPAKFHVVCMLRICISKIVFFRILVCNFQTIQSMTIFSFRAALRFPISAKKFHSHTFCISQNLSCLKRQKRPVIVDQLVMYVNRKPKYRSTQYL